MLTYDFSLGQVVYYKEYITKSITQTIKIDMCTLVEWL